MKCKNCGFENEKNALFCEECGNRLEQNSNNSSSRTNPNEKEENFTNSPVGVGDSLFSNEGTKDKKTKKPISKKKIFSFIVLAIILLVFTSSYLIGKNYYSKDNQVDRYIETLNTSDAAKISSILHTEDPNFKLNKETINPYAEYIKNNKEYINSLKSELKNVSTDKNSEKSIYLKKKGKVFLLFDRYDLMINPIYTEITTNMKDAELSLDGKKIGKADEENYVQKVGPLAPGEYEIKSEAERYGEPLINEQKVDFVENPSEDIINLALDGVNFDVSSTLLDGVVYLNDKKLGNLKDGYRRFGPIAWTEDSYLSVRKDFPSGTLTSKKVSLAKEEDTYSFDVVSLDEEVAEEFLNHIYDTAGILAYYDETEQEDIASDQYGLASLLVNGEENELYGTFNRIAEKYRENEDFYNVNYFAEVTDLKRTDIGTFEVLYDLSIQEEFYEKVDQQETQPYKAEIVINDIEKDYDSIYDYDLKLNTVESLKNKK